MAQCNPTSCLFPLPNLTLCLSPQPPTRPQPAASELPIPGDEDALDAPTPTPTTTTTHTHTPHPPHPPDPHLEMKIRSMRDQPMAALRSRWRWVSSPQSNSQTDLQEGCSGVGVGACGEAGGDSCLLGGGGGGALPRSWTRKGILGPRAASLPAGVTGCSHEATPAAAAAAGASVVPLRANDRRGDHSDPGGGGRPRQEHGLQSGGVGQQLLLMLR